MDLSLWTTGDWLTFLGVLVGFFAALTTIITPIIIWWLSRPRIHVRILVYRRVDGLDDKSYIHIIVTNHGRSAMTIIRSSIGQTFEYQPENSRGFEHTIDLVNDRVLNPGRIWKCDVPLSDLRPSSVYPYTYFCIFHSQEEDAIYKDIDIDEVKEV